MAVIKLLKRILSQSPMSSIQSALSVTEDYLFDIRYQLDTQSEVAIGDLDISPDDKMHADKYKPTRARYFRKLMEKIDPPRDCVFVDVGCGKGRVLLLAVEFGFKQVVGLEISPALCQIASSNLATFNRVSGRTNSIDIICSNILDYQLEGNESIFFLYSPFDLPVTDRFFQKLRKSLQDHPRDLHLIINEFRFPELLADDDFFTLETVFRYGAAVFSIYTFANTESSLSPDD